MLETVDRSHATCIPKVQGLPHEQWSNRFMSTVVVSIKGERDEMDYTESRAC
jgi:hypothetical protein